MKVSRTLRAVTTLALALAVTACGGGDDGGASGGGTVTFAGYGGTGQEALAKAWLDPFAGQSGVRVVQDNPVTYAKIHQMVDARNVTWDVAQGGVDFGLEDNPRLEDIDCSVVACDDYADGPFKIYKQGVPLFVFSIVLAYNTDKFGASPPRNYADFFDTAKYPGKRAIDGTAGFQGILEAALMADGVARDELYPLDVGRALKLLEPIKDDLIVFKDAGECINLISSGEAVMGNCYNGRVKLAKDEGRPIDNAWGQQIYLCDYLFVPKGAPNKANAMKLIAHIAAAANNGKITQFIPYGPANPKATASGEYAADAPTAHVLKGEDAPIIMDSAWWNANMEKAIEQTTAWLAG
ncbi:putative spermidine/putrescine transport system substrate-binding protein [Thermocatellispora tengchongensis]|uniref:Putative spermidine/putrescine transport system substrate-binding protein n=1 Tax=Thermocatellispora tengchongensis TaxID=1073253 RepID=A0A840PHC6_9ACTN|nr:extracellular solute-binding protein [Thermocatellispora tengchongensis]MBB5135435.1 putative spermidine/putrescine transport system substrate-binding protein [Thermocatellispora tengchongensis]